MFGFRLRACCTIFLSGKGSTTMKQAVEQFPTVLSCLVVELKRVFISIVLEVLVTHNLPMYFYKPFFQQSATRCQNGNRLLPTLDSSRTPHECSQSPIQLTVTHNSLTHQHGTNCTSKSIARWSPMALVLFFRLVTPPNPRNCVISNLRVP